MAKRGLKTISKRRPFNSFRRRNGRKGIFITFEGPEGCGKTTHSRLLFEYLKKSGYGCIHTREPGGTLLGESVRKVLLHSGKIDISDLSELFLFEACRSQVVSEVIEPGIKSGKIVICDRFTDATLAYQGYGGGIDLDKIEELNRIASGGIIPDITILLDLDTVTGLDRAKDKGIDRMERKDLAYHRRVRGGYLRLAERCPGRIKVISVNGPIEDVQAVVRREVDIVIKKYKSA